MTPSTSDDKCRPQLLKPLPQQSQSHKEDKQDTTQVTVMSPWTSIDSCHPQLLKPLPQQSHSHKEDKQDTAQVKAMLPSHSKDNCQLATNRELSHLKDSLSINEGVEGQQKRI